MSLKAYYRATELPLKRLATATLLVTAVLTGMLLRSCSQPDTATKPATVNNTAQVTDAPLSAEAIQATARVL